jgi:hypothetical protein
MLFILKDVLFSYNVDNKIFLKASPMSNYKDLTQYEQCYNKENNIHNYQSSVHLMGDHFGVMLSLVELINIELSSFSKTSLNFHIEIENFDKTTQKHLYKIYKIEIADSNSDNIVEDENDKILDFYEIKNMFTSLECDVSTRIREKRQKLSDLEKNISEMDITLENIDVLDKMKRNFLTYI